MSWISSILSPTQCIKAAKVQHCTRIHAETNVVEKLCLHSSIYCAFLNCRRWNANEKAWSNCVCSIWLQCRECWRADIRCRWWADSVAVWWWCWDGMVVVSARPIYGLCAAESDSCEFKLSLLIMYLITLMFSKQAPLGVWGLAGLKIPIGAHFFRWAILTRKLGQADLVCGVR